MAAKLKQKLTLLLYNNKSVYPKGHDVMAVLGLTRETSCMGSMNKFNQEWAEAEPLWELSHIAAVVVCIVGGQRLTKGQDESKPPALATWGNVGKRARE